MERKFSTRKKDGGIQLILSYKVDKKWRQVSQQGFKTVREANQHKDDLLERVRRIAPLTDDKTLADITLRQFKKIFAMVQKDTLEYGTIRSYDNAIQALSHLADEPLRTLTPAMLIQAFAIMPQSPATKNLYLSKIRKLLRYAVDPYKIIAANPADKVPKAKVKSSNAVKALTPDALAMALEAFRSQHRTAHAICAIAAYAGLRRGEIIALRWVDIDFVKNEIRVDHQLSKIAGGIQIKAPKSANGVRTVPMPAKLRQILLQYRADRPIRIDGFIFTPQYNTEPIDKIIKKIAGITLHGFRHTYATQLLANGVDIKTVAALLGDKVETVIGTYIHYTDDMRKAAAEKVDKIFA